MSIQLTPHLDQVVDIATDLLKNQITEFNTFDFDLYVT